jgi:hypothetical protein
MLCGIGIIGTPHLDTVVPKKVESLILGQRGTNYANLRIQVCQILNILTESLNYKYLGLPTHFGLDRSDCVQYLVDRVCQRIEGWKEKNYFTSW